MMKKIVRISTEAVGLTWTTVGLSVDSGPVQGQLLANRSQEISRCTAGDKMVVLHSLHTSVF